MTKFLSIHELSEILGLTEAWIRKHAKAGKLPFVRDANRMRFPADEAIAAAELIATSSRPQETEAVTNG
ncbi:hypothetical protein LF1_18640 [Rubripirellula obstinata]|uniref:Helix-turn-helix domain-containing protein n=1 Tax=Rubripirellula obstinata TaxID=406547 RepID=A0A5B1CGL8_9BACT|nr:helix-turn-helix domain-containing protein [Rubripirellula obstinata]KAA1259332.1 hypothetical protein LF1_18640 [Rubripirellula obstinata]